MTFYIENLQIKAAFIMYHKVDSPTGDSLSLEMLVLLPLSDLAIGLGVRISDHQ